MYKIFLALTFLSLAFVSCEKEVHEYEGASINDYYPLEEGRYVIYSLDSILFTNFGQVQTTISYEVKDEVDSKIADNNGRTAYRIIRYFRKKESDPWQPNNTFMAVNNGKALEFVENNLRFLKLALPIKEGYSWKGNSFIDTYPVDDNLQYLLNWNYSYDSVDAPFTIQNLDFPNTIKVMERDEFLGQDPSLPGTAYAEKNYSVAYYAKDIGLIYREFMHWVYQGVQSGRPAYYTGYGIIMKIKSYN